MGLFGTQPRPEPISNPIYEEEPFDELPTLPKARDVTVLAKGITFTGVIRGEGSVQVEGRLEGEIDLQGGVTVAAGGMVQGPITADSVRVAGNVQGSITARNNLCLECTGEIHGDVTTASLVVENGRLDGSSTMLPPSDRPREPEPPKPGLRFGDGYRAEEE